MASRNYYTSVVMGSTEPDPPQDGLIIWLDAGRVASYPGTGTTWFDLKGNSNFPITQLGTSNVWNSGGYFVLNPPTTPSGPPSNGHMSASFNPLLHTSSMTFIFRLKTAVNQSVYCNGQSTAFIGAFQAGNKYYNGSSGSPSLFIDGVSRANLYDFVRDNAYHNIEFSNASILANSAAWTFIRFNWYNFGAGKFIFDNNSEISHIMVYNKVLTAGERTALNAYLNY